ncbi:hypothetical protein JCM1841_002170 [Sporobolomyces salmonicolor]
MLGSRVLLRPASSATTSLRTYLYDVDHHGQLFLSSTQHRTVATCYRDPTFLRTFYARLKRNEGGNDEAKQLRKEGYEFVSPCMGEMNYVRPGRNASALVFQELHGRELVYAGDLHVPFDPTSLRVDAVTGYLFHPSPRPGRARDKGSPYGPYSLLRSSLVMERFADSLELDDGRGGSFEYEGGRYGLGVLTEGDVYRRQDRHVRLL